MIWGCQSMVDHVVPHRPEWKHAFLCEAHAIQSGLSGTEIELHHIGSTSIEGILAKPIIDILGAVSDLKEIDSKSGAFEGLGYEVMGAFGIAGRRYFRKVDGLGKRTHHLHIFQTGSAHIERHLAFRDYLVEHPGKAAEYSALKAKLTSSRNAT